MVVHDRERLVEVNGLDGAPEDVDTEVTAWFRPALGVPELNATVFPESPDDPR